MAKSETEKISCHGTGISIAITSNNIDSNFISNYETFTILKTISVAFSSSTWNDLYSRCDQNKKSLPPGWTTIISNALAEALPYCCIHLKRHKLYSNNENTSCLAKFWYYCNIESCELEGSDVLDTSLSLTLCNKYTELKYEKGKRNSFQARSVKGEERKVLAKEVADMIYIQVNCTIADCPPLTRNHF